MKPAPLTPDGRTAKDQEQLEKQVEAELEYDRDFDLPGDDIPDSLEY